VFLSHENILKNGAKMNRLYAIVFALLIIYPLMPAAARETRAAGAAAGGSENAAKPPAAAETNKPDALVVKVTALLDECMKGAFTKEDLPAMLAYYSTYTSEAKGAVAQAANCEAMLAYNDEKACDVFKALPEDAAYMRKVMLPLSPQEAAGSAAAGGGKAATDTLSLPSETVYTEVGRLFPANEKSCKNLVGLVAMLNRALVSPEACNGEFSALCKRETLCDPRDANCTCERFAILSCSILDMENESECADLYKKFGAPVPVIGGLCRMLISGNLKGAPKWVSYLYAGCAVKQKKDWPLCGEQFDTDTVEMDPAIRVFKNALGGKAGCFSQISPDDKKQICVGVAKIKAGLPNLDDILAPESGPKGAADEAGGGGGSNK
jgi:hypothetical protein